MKRLYLLSIALLSLQFISAQQGINYKALIKDGSGNVVANDLIAIQFTILEGAGMTNVYQETHTPNTDANGIVIVNIGQGTTSNDFTAIDWGSDDHYLNVQINTGSGLSDMGTTQFMAVPYALHALTSDNGYWFQNGDAIYNTNENIGIGTNEVEAKMKIFHNSLISDPHILLHEEGNDYARLNFKNDNGSNYWSIASYIASNHRNDRLNFYNSVGGDVMTITGDGEVGIGVGISPKVDLHVGDQRRVLFGTDTIGAGDKLMWLPDLHAFRVGTVSSGSTSTYWNRDSIGSYSFASGLNTRAQGFGSTAMGRDTEATNSYAFASGFFTNADGQYSTAMGYNSDAFALGSTALGYSTDAEANYSFAAGYFAEAQAIYSVAIGNRVKAQSYASMAVGRHNVGGGNADSWVLTDPIFEIGIGTGPSNLINAVTVRKNGNVGIGTTLPMDALHVNGRIRFATVEYFEDGGSSEIASMGDIRPTTDNVYDLGTPSFRWDDVYATNGTIQTSDARVKTDIKETEYGLDQVLMLKPVNFKWKSSSDKSKHIGLLAQDLLKVIPEVVKTHDFQMEEDGTIKEVKLDVLGVNYSNLIPVLIKAIQGQQDIIEDLKTENKNQNNVINSLKSEIDTRLKYLEETLNKFQK